MMHAILRIDDGGAHADCLSIHASSHAGILATGRKMFAGWISRTLAAATPKERLYLAAELRGELTTNGSAPMPRLLIAFIEIPCGARHSRRAETLIGSMDRGNIRVEVK